MLDGHNASQIYSVQISITTQDDITRTTQCLEQPYRNNQSSEVPGRSSGATTQFQTATHWNMASQSPKDQAWLNQSDLKQSTFEIQQHNWSGNKKEGKALLHQKNIKANLTVSDHTHTMENAIWKTILWNKPLHMIGIYHPPPGSNITNAIFIDKITELLTNRIPKYNNMVLLGDLNIHIDDLSNADSHVFNDTMQAFGFKQHITSPTQ